MEPDCQTPEGVLILSQRVRLLSICIAVCLIIAANSVIFFVLTRNSLESNHNREIESIAHQIQSSVEQSRIGSKLYEDMIGEKLRLASIAAQQALPADVEEVTTDQLVALRDRLQLQGLTLLKRTPDNIVLYKSSNADEVGLSTKGWGNWYKAFQELFDNRNVTMDWGQKLPNYWSGPYEIASADIKRISKWGYYYDGTTNYMLDPYVDDTAWRRYQELTGTQAIIERTLQTYPFLLEVTGINPATFGHEKTFITEKGETLDPLVHRPVFFGSYEIKHTEKDARFIQTAIQTGATVSYQTTYNGKHIQKTFIPVQSQLLDEATPIPDPDLLYKQYAKKSAEVTKNQYYVLNLVSDMDKLDAQLSSQFKTLMIIFAGLTLLSIAILFVIIRLVSNSRDKAVKETSETYAEEVNRMFLNIRGQRHDFLNHVNVIHSFVELEKYEELHQYTKTLVEDIGGLNDLIRIGQPEIAAIIQAKMVTAMNKKIQLIHNIASMERIMTGAKSMDLVRIIGNLIDNAYDEVMELDAELRQVECRGWLEGKHFHFTVINPMRNALTEEEQASLFRAGFTTKTGQNHAGLGLAITQNLIHKHRGTISVDARDKQIEFHVSIPIG